MRKQLFVILLIGLVAVACQKETIENNDGQVTALLKKFPDPFQGEVQLLAQQDPPPLGVMKTMSSKKSATASVGSSGYLLEIQRLDSGFISGFVRTYLVRATDALGTSISFGYLTQTFTGLDQDGNLGPYKLSLVWGLKAGDGHTKTVIMQSTIQMDNITKLEWTTTAGSLSYTQEITPADSIVLLPPMDIQFNASLANLACSGHLAAGAQLLDLQFSIESTVEAVIVVPIPEELQAYASKIWVCIQSKLANVEHFHRSYSIAAGATELRITLPFTSPSSIAMEVNVLRKGNWSDTTLYYGSDFQEQSSEDEILIYQATIAKL